MKDYPLDTNYAVTEDGRIYSKRRNKFLTPKANWDGYHRIQIWDKGKCTYVSWHRVVAETYLVKLNEDMVVNHINGIKTDNRVENLEWVTQSENILHAWETGLSKRRPNCKATSKPVDRLTKDYVYIDTFPSQMEVERQLGIGHGHVSYAIKQNATAGGFKWRYSETSND